MPENPEGRFSWFFNRFDKETGLLDWKSLIDIDPTIQKIRIKIDPQRFLPDSARKKNRRTVMCQALTEDGLILKKAEVLSKPLS